MYGNKLGTISSLALKTCNLYEQAFTASTTAGATSSIDALPGASAYHDHMHKERILGGMRGLEVPSNFTFVNKNHTGTAESCRCWATQWHFHLVFQGDQWAPGRPSQNVWLAAIVFDVELARSLQCSFHRTWPIVPIDPVLTLASSLHICIW